MLVIRVANDACRLRHNVANITEDSLLRRIPVYTQSGTLFEQPSSTVHFKCEPLLLHALLHQPVRTVTILTPMLVMAVSSLEHTVCK